MLKKLLQHLSIALVFFVLTLCQQYLFYWVKELPIVWLTFGKYFATFAFFFVATFIRPSWLRFVFLVFVMVLNLFQMAHLSYFGTQILPSEIFLLLTQFHEIQGTLLAELHHVLVPLAFTLAPVIFGYFLLKRFPARFSHGLIGALFCLYFVYNPVRTLITGNTWGRQPSTRELAGMNVYLSFSYFLGKILPHKITMGRIDPFENTSTKLDLGKKQRPHWDNIILILGESLTPNHMELFGYERKTTPFLTKLKDSPKFHFARGLSGGVSTDIAVAFLLNMGFGEAGSAKAAKGNHCLFKLAKDQGYSTHFLSIQSSEQLRYIAPYVCASSLDEYKSLEDIAPHTEDHQAANDRDLLPSFQKLLLSPKRKFIILHQRGSHGPWELRSSPEAKLFKEETKTDHYDNSVVEFDLFMQRFVDVINTVEERTLVVYVSDHGEGLGENGTWGHGSLVRSSFEVPILYYAVNSPLPQGVRSAPEFLTHYNLSLLLARELGYSSNQDAFERPNDYVIFGNDIDGFAGKGTVKFTEKGYEFKKVQ
jgi:glucan phosphoethanolaminetransferase (alkaline phosphatase superfamily)